MNLQPRIENISGKKLIGKRLRMTILADKTSELWKSFMPRRSEIKNQLSNDLISMQLYDPSVEFDKWAAVEVSNFDEVPDGMDSFNLPRGRYAVFDYKGMSGDPSIFQYIFDEWLPSSGYELDNRPHFEILGSRFNVNDPHSEETIWIPVRGK